MPTAGRSRPMASSGSAISPRTSGLANRACGGWPPRARTSARPPSPPRPTRSPPSPASDLLAFAGPAAPPRPTAKDSIATAKAAGIRVRMITGDHAVTAAAIARQLGIDGTVITGAEFAAITDDELLTRIDDIGV